MEENEFETFEKWKNNLESNNNPNQQALINLYGDELFELFKKYRPMLDILITNNGLHFTDSEEQSEVKSKEDLLRDSVINYFSEFTAGQRIAHINEVTSLEVLREISEFRPLNELPWRGISKGIFSNYTPDDILSYGITDMSQLLTPVTDLYKIKELLGYLPEDLINLGQVSREKIAFIKKYGIDNIIRLDEETNGMFSHPVFSNGIYLDLFATTEAIHGNAEISNEISYEEFKDKMYEILAHARQNRGILKSGDYPNYDFIQGSFRSEHPDIFLDGDFSESIKDLFYLGRLKSSDIRDNPELIDALKDKHLQTAFMNKQITLGYSANIKDSNGNIRGRIPYRTDMVEFLTNKFDNTTFLQLCYDYGKCLDDIGLKLSNDDSLEDIRRKIEDAIYEGIINESCTIDYFEDLPESFKNKHPDLFLPKEVPENIRNKFYFGTLSFDDIKKHPELKKMLLSVNTKIGFRKSDNALSSYGQITVGLSELWNKFAPEELLDLAQEYGSYLSYVNPNKLIKGLSREQYKSIIEGDIEYNILCRKATYGEAIPTFFKEKYPEFFLSPEAPEELRKYFDEDLIFDIRLKEQAEFDLGKIAGRTINVTGKDLPDKLSFGLIAAHEEWIPFLTGKNLRLAFPRGYDKLFTCFNNDTLLTLGCKYPETIKKMVDMDKEDLMKKWYQLTGGRFIPHHVVMLNFPEDEMGDFLSNRTKWSKLIQSDSFNVNDDGKAAILKLAYSLGVFQGNDEGFNIALNLITGLPNKISNEDFINVLNSLSDSNEDIELIKSVYSLTEEGNYKLRYNPQSNKKKTKHIRKILEQADISNILTLEKAHQIFGGFDLKYNPDFVQFFKKNIEKIISDSEHISDISQIQRRYEEIMTQDASISGGITYEVALNYIRQTPYKGDDIGNDRLAKLASQSGYSQKDFESLQELYNEGEMRNFSSIPRITGNRNSYTYEMLRLDDPLALVIGPLTDCCQALDDAGHTCMEHSMVSQDGRVFVVRDEMGRIVAQSWVWRNRNVVCFDNIEIPKARMEEYKKLHPEEGSNGLARHVLDVYKLASKELMKEDEATYRELLEEGIITQEEFDSLIVGKVTVGLGWNDTADAIRSDTELTKDNVHHLTLPEETDRFPQLYTDAKYDPFDTKNYEGQWVIRERKTISEPQKQQPPIYEDDIPVYDENNIDEVLLHMLQQMGEREKDSGIEYVDKNKSNSERTSNQIMKSIAYAYGINPSISKVISTHRMALLYTQSDGIIKLQDLFTAPIKDTLTEKQKYAVKAHIDYQIKKAVNQLISSGDSIDLNDMDDDKRYIIQSILDEIEGTKNSQGDDKDERGD